MPSWVSVCRALSSRCFKSSCALYRIHHHSCTDTSAGQFYSSLYCTLHSLSSFLFCSLYFRCVVVHQILPCIHCMKILHTADWHLGKTLKNMSLLDDQRYILEQVYTILDTEKPDMLIIAGDIFDRSVPPAEAVALWNTTINAIVQERGIKVFAVAGNHDSAERIDCYAPLLQKQGLYIAGKLHTTDIPAYTLDDQDGDVVVYLVPFLTPQDVQYLTGDATITSYQAVYEWVMTRIRAQHPAGVRSVIVAHCTVLGGVQTDSERALLVGGVEHVSAETFAGVDYVALGHLHKPQAFSEGRVRYAGSPLAYSTSEMNYKKSVSIVELDATGVSILREIPLHPKRILREIHAHIVGGVLLHEEDTTPCTPSEDFIVLRLHNTLPVPDAITLARTLFPNVVELSWVHRATTTRAIVSREGRSLLAHQTQSTPQALLEDFLMARMDTTREEINSIFGEVLREIIQLAGQETE